MFKTCMLCGETYNIIKGHDCSRVPKKEKKPKKKKLEVEILIEPPKAEGFKAYCQRFGIKKLKL